MSDTPTGAPDHDAPTLDDVMEPTETAVPDHRQHAKADPRPDDDDLERRTEHERRLTE